jgi:hypothetical protein
MSDIDWSMYRRQFPRRYLQESLFDRLFLRFIERYRSTYSDRLVSLLDVGGGQEKDKVGNAVDDYELLDPSVEHSDVSWDEVRHTGSKFFEALSFVRLRGSIAYLSQEELSWIEMAVKKGSIVGFNTFAYPPVKEIISRRYTSEEGEGIEVIQYDAALGMINHTLAPKDGDPISHSFHYRPWGLYLTLLDPFRKAFVTSSFSPPNSFYAFLGRDKKFMERMVFDF